MQPSTAMRPLAALLAMELFFASFALAQEPLETPRRIPGLNAELFGIDRAHSTLEFTIDFMGFAPVRGRFDTYDIALLYDADDVTRTSITLVIDAASINTHLEFRDNDLRSERFFHTEAYPHILFQSERIEAVPDGFIAHGPLTMRGVTRTIAVPFHHTLPRTLDAGWGNARVGFAGSLTLDRTDYGVDGDEFWGTTVLSKEVTITFHLLGTIYNMVPRTYASSEKPSIGQVLDEHLAADGLDAALAAYRRLRAEAPGAYNFSESQLRLLTYKLMQRGQFDEALGILQVYAEAFPESVHLYTSLGEIYALQGDHDKALASYRRALELAPITPSAMEMVRRLAAGG